MQIAIICGGLATRLKDLAKKTPKSMMKINGKPFLEYQIEMLKKQNIKDIVLCVGHLSEKIIEYFEDGKSFGVNIEYSYDGNKKLGPMGAIKNAEKLLEKEFFIMYGDSFIFVNFQKVYDFYKKNNKLGCMVVYKNKDLFDKSNLAVENNMVLDIKNLIKNKKLEYIDYGTSIFNKKSLDFIKDDAFCSTATFFKKMIQENELLAYETNKRFYHIGTPEALEEFRSFIKDK